MLKSTSSQVKVRKTHRKMNTQRLVAQVKWFDKKKGFGFLEDSKTGTNFFVHHSSLQVKDPKTFRYLSIGEYVEYSIVPNNSKGKHKTIASDVTGIHRGLLMCEYWANYQKTIQTDEEDGDGEDAEAAAAGEGVEYDDFLEEESIVDNKV